MARPRIFTKANIGIYAFSVAIGCISLLFNFQSLLKAVARKGTEGHPETQATLLSILDWPTQVVTANHPDVNEVLFMVMKGSSLGLWLFAGALLFLAMVHRDHKIPTYGIGGWFVGISWITIVAWSGLILLMIIEGVLAVIRWIGWLIGLIASWIIWLIILCLLVRMSLNNRTDENGPG